MNRINRLNALAAALLIGSDASPPVRQPYRPTRPGLIKSLRRCPVGVDELPKFDEVIHDNSRYPGHVLRAIRAGHVVDGHSNRRERDRRLARNCVQ